MAKLVIAILLIFVFIMFFLLLCIIFCSIALVAFSKNEKRKGLLPEGKEES